MTILLVGAAIVVALVIVVVWLMERADAEPAARATGRSDDPAEEAEARRRSEPSSSILSEPDQR